MKSYKFITSVVVVLLLCMLFSCGESAENTVNPINPTKSDDETGELVEETDLLSPNLPDNDFDGYEFRMLNIDQESMWWGIVDVDTEEQTGEAVNDAIYNRNRTIEEKYNFKIKEANVSSSQVASILRKNSQAGDDEYDVAFPSTGDLIGLITNNTLTNLNAIPYLDFDKPWWNTSVRQYFSLKNKMYFMTSDLLLTDNEDAIVLMYNKKIAQATETESAEEIYALVDEGKWTLDKFNELCKKANFDMNGDGVQKGNDDRYGLITCDWMYQAMMVGFGETITEKADNDEPIFACNTPRYLDAYEKMIDFMSQRDSVLREYIDTSAGTESVFMNDRALFCGEVLACVRLYKNMGSDFGLLPMPKLDESQAVYYTPVQWSTGVAVPITNTNHERTGFIIEALTAESRKTLMPAYYEVAIGMKYLRDEGSFRMLDVILANQAYDIVTDLYEWGGFKNALLTAGKKGDSNFVSLFEKYQARIQADIEKTLEIFE